MPVLLLAYPVLVHLAVLWSAPRLEWLALVVMCAIPLYQGLRALRPGHWLSLLVLAGLLWVRVNPVHSNASARPGSKRRMRAPLVPESSPSGSCSGSKIIS